jgi:hypothetical protein
MRSSLSKLLATHFFCLLALAGRAFAQPATTTTTSTSTEFTSVIGTLCGAGETISVTGRVHHLQHITQTSAGVTSRVTHINVQALGTGQVTGEQYVFTQNTNVAFNTQQPTPLESTETETIQIIGRGQTDDRYIRALFHTTISATGELTAEVQAFERHCR